jgi:hypothetical protein
LERRKQSAITMELGEFHYTAIEENDENTGKELEEADADHYRCVSYGCSPVLHSQWEQQLNNLAQIFLRLDEQTGTKIEFYVGHFIGTNNSQTNADVIQAFLSSLNTLKTAESIDLQRLKADSEFSGFLMAIEQWAKRMEQLKNRENSVFAD